MRESDSQVKSVDRYSGWRPLLKYLVPLGFLIYGVVSNNLIVAAFAFVFLLPGLFVVALLMSARNRMRRDD